ncbi:hypothetical protein [Streptomyces sp. NPDC008001]|uniref:hypothetical protein n=1 Tax=Streptomyces sp. NPDC008001 TaxID=3364804 RepID=UPI0036ECF7D1
MRWSRCLTASRTRPRLFSLRLEDVMDRTATSKSQLFHYFPGGKEELPLAVARELLRHWQDQLAAGIRRMQDIGEVTPELDADREAAALLASIQGGVMIFMTTGSLERLEAALNQSITHLRGMSAEAPSVVSA